MDTHQTANGQTTGIRRRQFLGRAAASIPLVAGSSTALAAEAESKAAAEVRVQRKLRIGIVGLGSRGSWIANLFKRHPGYEITAAVDYFQETADKVGETLGVPAKQRFSGLSGYKRALDSGVDALVLEGIPYFYPEQTAAAIDAGCHVYMAKPFAVNVPSVFAMQALAKKATQKKLCMLVDYQLPTDAANQQLKQRIGDLRDAGYTQFAVQLTPGNEDAIEDWARIAKAF